MASAMVSTPLRRGFLAPAQRLAMRMALSCGRDRVRWPVPLASLAQRPAVEPAALAAIPARPARSCCARVAVPGWRRARALGPPVMF